MSDEAKKPAITVAHDSGAPAEWTDGMRAIMVDKLRVSDDAERPRDYWEPPGLRYGGKDLREMWERMRPGGDGPKTNAELSAERRAEQHAWDMRAAAKAAAAVTLADQHRRMLELLRVAISECDHIGACYHDAMIALVAEIDGARLAAGLVEFTREVAPATTSADIDVLIAADDAMRTKAQQHRDNTPGCPTCGMQPQVNGCGGGKCGA